MRWTIRGVSPAAVAAVQRAQAELGTPLGTILTECIVAGLDQARTRLAKGHFDDHDIEAFQRIVRTHSELRQDLARLKSRLRSLGFPPLSPS